MIQCMWKQCLQRPLTAGEREGVWLMGGAREMGRSHDTIFKVVRLAHGKGDGCVSKFGHTINLKKITETTPAIPR